MVMESGRHYLSARVSRRNDRLLFLCVSSDRWISWVPLKWKRIGFGLVFYFFVFWRFFFLQVRINLGAGEAEVATPRGFRLDDLRWHHVRIHRKDADFTMTVDGVHSAKSVPVAMFSWLFCFTALAVARNCFLVALLGIITFQLWFEPSFTGFYRVLPGFTGFYWVKMGSTGYLLGFTEVF